MLPPHDACNLNLGTTSTRPRCNLAIFAITATSRYELGRGASGGVCADDAGCASTTRLATTVVEPPVLKTAVAPTAPLTLPVCDPPLSTVVTGYDAHRDRLVTHELGEVVALEGERFGVCPSLHHEHDHHTGDGSDDTRYIINEKTMIRAPYEPGKRVPYHASALMARPSNGLMAGRAPPCVAFNTSATMKTIALTWDSGTTDTMLRTIELFGKAKRLPPPYELVGVGNADAPLKVGFAACPCLLFVGDNREIVPWAMMALYCELMARDLASTGNLFDVSRVHVCMDDVMRVQFTAAASVPIRRDAQRLFVTDVLVPTDAEHVVSRDSNAAGNDNPAAHARRRICPTHTIQRPMLSRSLILN